jgi:hypothetical protein
MNQVNTNLELSIFNSFISQDLGLNVQSIPQLSKKRARLSSFEQVMSFDSNFIDNFNNYDCWNQFNIRKRTIDENECIFNFSSSFPKNTFINNDDEDVLLQKTYSIDISDNLNNKTNSNVFILFNLRAKQFRKKKILSMLILISWNFKFLSIFI